MAHERIEINPEIMGGICTNDFHTQPSDTEKRP